MAELTVATWNVNGQANDQMLDLVNRVAPDVLFLQEVKTSKWPSFRDLEGWADGVYGLDLWPQQPGQGGSYALGAAVLVRSALHEAGQVLDLPDIGRPERLIKASIPCAACQIPMTLVAYHALHGGHGTTKPRTAERFAQWLEEQAGPVIVGMDANSPNLDHPDEDKIECFWDQPETHDMERRLVSGDRRHRLSDVWRTYLDEHPRKKMALVKYQPLGPLAVTHFTGSHRVRVPKRFDHIWATPDFAVADVKHIHRGFRAGSDHALVWARLVHQCS